MIATSSKRLQAYQLINCLHRGALADVYLAQSPRFSHPVAVKIFHAIVVAAPDFQLRFEQSAKQAQQLRHPNIMQVYEAVYQPEEAFVVVEYLEGGNLQTRLDALQHQAGLLSLELISGLVKSVGNAVDFMHRAGVTHGALTPQAIFFTDTNEPVLDSFVLPISSPAPPAVRAAQDRTQFARLLYQLFTGAPPPVEATSASIAQRREINADSSAPYRVIARALAGQFDTLQALAVAFRQSLTLPPHRPTQLARYQIKRYCGSRKLFETYQAYDPLIHRQVMIFQLGRDSDNSAEVRLHFKQTTEKQAALTHKHIAHIYDYREENHEPFIVIPHLAGETVADRLAAGMIPLPELVPMLHQLAIALDTAHQAGIVHGDLRPASILLDDKNNLTLSDFGIPLVTAFSLFLSWQSLAEVQYISPEEAEAIQKQAPVVLSRASNIYSLGLLIIHALTGQLPYQAQTPYATALARLTEPLPKLRQLNPHLPETVQSVLDQALARNPADRYPTARQLARELEEALNGRWYLRKISSLSFLGSDTSPSQPAVASTSPQAVADAFAQERPLFTIGRYQVLRELGRGGMAIVYLAYDPYINRSVAIKVLSPRLMEDSTFLAQFRREAELVAALEYDPIVRVYDYGEQANQPYLVMDYIGKGTLAEQLAGKPMRLQKLIPIVERVANALEFAHQWDPLESTCRHASLSIL